ncbi:MAG: hypothetical protein LBI02_00810 [Opitutaceae bacterium]|jgi:hypothetical protein|nr:hypothetical protein [Opitutaceae bacterium]
MDSAECSARAAAVIQRETMHPGAFFHSSLLFSLLYRSSFFFPLYRSRSRYLSRYLSSFLVIFLLSSLSFFFPLYLSSFSPKAVPLRREGGKKRKDKLMLRAAVVAQVSKPADGPKARPALKQTWKSALRQRLRITSEIKIKKKENEERE